MAGGIGSRFWPMSRTSYPKQFLDILGIGQTLIQQTYLRFLRICPKENILVVTNQQYKKIVLEQLPELNEHQVLCEPARRNTAPCIVYACYKIAALTPEANIIVAPSDHLILKEDEFIETIQSAFLYASSNDSLVTLGIKPTRPDTGYGYIQFEEAESQNIVPLSDKRIRKVKSFTEKPNLEIAKQFLESGEFYWNSGIFIWRLTSVMSAIKRYLPNTNSLFLEGVGKYNTSEEEDFIFKTYLVCKNLSIDVGLMEKAKNVYVVLSDFGWSDLGTWGSLYSHIKKDESGNAVIGKNVRLYDSKNCIVNVPKGKLVVLQGLDDCIVVEANSVLLVCRKDDEQKIKQFVQDIKITLGEKYV